MIDHLKNKCKMSFNSMKSKLEQSMNDNKDDTFKDIFSSIDRIKKLINNEKKVNSLKSDVICSQSICEVKTHSIESFECNEEITENNKLSEKQNPNTGGKGRDVWRPDLRPKGPGLTPGGPDLTPRGPDLTSKVPSVKQYKCCWTGCGFTTEIKSNFDEHFRNHTKNWPFVCNFNVCDQRFPRKCQLDKHKLTHKGESTFKCDLQDCDSSFSIEANLNQHKLKHQKLKQFFCNYKNCGKKFVQKSHLIEHQRKHIRDDPIIYKCDYQDCEFNQDYFGSEAHLNKHKQGHNKGKPFICYINDCGKKFIHKSNLIKHKRTHKEQFNCTWAKCSFKTTIEQKLYDHINFHFNKERVIDDNRDDLIPSLIDTSSDEEQ